MQKGSTRGVGSGEWGVGMGKQFPCCHSPLPIAHYLFIFFAIFAIFASYSTGVVGTDFRVTAAQGQVSILVTSDPANPYKVAVEVYGLSAAAIKRLRQLKPASPQWRRLFSVYAGQEEPVGASDLPPMAGAYRVESNALRFEPQFTLEPGLRYRAVFRPDQLSGGSGAAPVESVYQSPRRS